MFDYFRQAKAAEIAALEEQARAGALPAPWAGRRPGFAAALRQKAADKGLAIIAEYKRASPSMGDINPSASLADTVRAYAQGGAAAMSVLTEESKFKGRLAFIREAFDQGADRFGLPLLRKDFIFHPLQVAATTATPAAAMLLIVKMTPSAKGLRGLREAGEKHGLESVVEVLDEGDLKIAREAGAKIIQVNARDFGDLSVDLERVFALARLGHTENDGELWIAASGFSRPGQLRAARDCGYAAALIGTALMAGGDLAALTGDLCQQ